MWHAWLVGIASAVAFHCPQLTVATHSMLTAELGTARIAFVLCLPGVLTLQRSGGCLHFLLCHVVTLHHPPLHSTDNQHVSHLHNPVVTALCLLQSCMWLHFIHCC